MTELVKKAYDLAKWAHEGQVRKFTGKSYFDEHVVKVWEKTKEYGATEDEEIAALLHDTVEDCPDKVTHDLIEKEFGKVASGYVKELTSDDEMIEKMGKAEYMKDKLSHISEGGLKVKLADRYCNISDMMTAPEKFRNKYYPETRTMLEGVEGRSLPEAQQKIVDDINEILDAVKKKYYENKAYRNKYIKMYEAFKKKNITVDDLVQCVNHGGVIYTQIIKNLPDNDPEQPLHTVSVDDDGLVTVEIDGKNYEVEMKNIDKIEYDKK